jgi:hypothetical protein
VFAAHQSVHFQMKTFSLALGICRRVRVAYVDPRYTDLRFQSESVGTCETSRIHRQDCPRRYVVAHLRTSRVLRLWSRRGVREGGVFCTHGTVCLCGRNNSIVAICGEVKPDTVGDVPNSAATGDHFEGLAFREVNILLRQQFRAANDGTGVSPDPFLIAKSFKLGADQHSPHGQYGYAMCLANATEA